MQQKGYVCRLVSINNCLAHTLQLSYIISEGVFLFLGTFNFYSILKQGPLITDGRNRNEM